MAPNSTLKEVRGEEANLINFLISQSMVSYYLSYLSKDTYFMFTYFDETIIGLEDLYWKKAKNWQRMAIVMVPMWIFTVAAKGLKVK